MLEALQETVAGPWRPLLVVAAVGVVFLAAWLAAWRVAQSPFGAVPSWIALSVALPLLILTAKVLTLLGLGAGATDPMTGAVDRLTQLLLWLVGAVVVLRGLDALYWSRQTPDTAAGAITAALRPALAAGVLVVAFLGGLAFAYGDAVAALLVALALLAATFVLVARPALDDLLGALVLLRAPSYAVGDWLSFEDGSAGRVASIDWRTTRLVGEDNGSVVIPNARAARMRHVNHSATDAPYVDIFSLAL